MRFAPAAVEIRIVNVFAVALVAYQRRRVPRSPFGVSRTNETGAVVAAQAREAPGGRRGGIVVGDRMDASGMQLTLEVVGSVDGPYSCVN